MRPKARAVGAPPGDRGVERAEEEWTEHARVESPAARRAGVERLDEEAAAAVEPPLRFEEGEKEEPRRVEERERVPIVRRAASRCRAGQIGALAARVRGRSVGRAHRGPAPRVHRRCRSPASVAGLDCSAQIVSASLSRTCRRSTTSDRMRGGRRSPLHAARARLASRSSASSDQAEQVRGVRLEAGGDAGKLLAERRTGPDHPRERAAAVADGNEMHVAE